MDAKPAPTYMVDNTRNSHGVAPDKGSMDGPMLSDGNMTGNSVQHNDSTLHARDNGFWLPNIKHGQVLFCVPVLD